MKHRSMAITMKGRAILDAIDVGICPEVDGGYELSAFEKFWERFGSKVNELESDLATERRFHRYWHRKFCQAMVALGIVVVQSLVVLATIIFQKIM